MSNDKLLVKNLKTGRVYTWTIDQALEEINRDHFDGWIEFVESDWEGGWMEFVEGRNYTICIWQSDLEEINRDKYDGPIVFMLLLACVMIALVYFPYLLGLYYG